MTEVLQVLQTPSAQYCAQGGQAKFWQPIPKKCVRKCQKLAAKFFLRPKSKTCPHFKREMHFYRHPENFRRKY